MSSASGENIRLLGATLIRLSGSDAHGRTHSTRQMVYITDRIGPFYLSRAACTDLGILSDKFPSIGEALRFYKDESSSDSLHILSENQPSDSNDDPIAPCGCLKRTAPPPFPQVPFPVTESNQLHLQNLLLEHFKGIGP